MNELIKETEKCVSCENCRLICPTYLISGNDLEIPFNRLRIAKKVFENSKLNDQEYMSIYSCTKCGICDMCCSSEINISEIIGKAREALFQQNYELLPGHQQLRNGIITRKNSVKGDPEHLLDYLPENFQYNKDSDTLFYAGCLSGYFIKNIARSSVIVLKKLGIEFNIIADEICCGSPLVAIGDVESAEKIFKENLEIFRKNNIKQLIVPCSGCYRSFQKLYPEIIGETIPVRHIVEVIAEALNNKNLKIEKVDTRVIYHDPCHLGREFDMYDPPRKVLKSFTKNLVEFDNTKQNTDCCGANSAVRAAFKDLSVKIALKRVREASQKADILVTTCPFCVFNLNYAVRKNDVNIKVQYLTEFLADILS
ncbi:MAG: (Fe-S)-binding protein [Candidatus Helarchaeota archaeon]